MATCETHGHLYGHNGKCVMCKEPKPPTASPALLTQEQLEPLLSKLRTPNSVSVLAPTHIFAPAEAAALLQHIAALDEAQTAATWNANMLADANARIATLEQRVEAQQTDIAFAYQCLHGMYSEGPECDCEYGHSCGWPKFRDFMERIAPAALPPCRRSRDE